MGSAAAHDDEPTALGADVRLAERGGFGPTSGGYLPDALIKNAGATTFDGNDVYSEAATGEKVSAEAFRDQQVRGGRPNDGTQDRLVRREGL